MSSCCRARFASRRMGRSVLVHSTVRARHVRSASVWAAVLARRRNSGCTRRASHISGFGGGVAPRLPTSGRNEVKARSLTNCGSRPASGTPMRSKQRLTPTLSPLAQTSR